MRLDEILGFLEWLQRFCVLTSDTAEESPPVDESIAALPHQLPDTAHLRVVEMVNCCKDDTDERSIPAPVSAQYTQMARWQFSWLHPPSITLVDGACARYFAGEGLRVLGYDRRDMDLDFVPFPTGTGLKKGGAPTPSPAPDPALRPHIPMPLDTLQRPFVPIGSGSPRVACGWTEGRPA
ncbi:hypothetical protein G7046_g756 [Stylonectria norvegica]|nr:hypothetical protein G7046_g756 [Stylonectria norvegica]